MIKNLLKKIIRKVSKINLERDEEFKLMNGKQLCFLQSNVKVKGLSDIEFKVFSQWGEDGIIEYLVNNIPIKNKFFIEFGVENYNESNTRLLMMNRNWSGLVIDGSKENVDYIKTRDYYWKYELTALHSFITKENINSIIEENLSSLNINRDIGLLSVDIDGVDYWVLNEISCIDPSIIICEYNSLFGNKFPLTVPYDKSFVRSEKHYSNLYWGANLKAFDFLLKKRNYIYIGSNSQQLNAFFVKRELIEKYIPSLLDQSITFEFSKIRDSRDQDGNLNFLDLKGKMKEVQNLELVNLEKNQQIKIKDLL